jgi:GNAT superfamily N-acetyltransferase
MLREAIISDISQIQVVRNAVKENTLSNPALVTDADCEEFITKRGKGWVYEINNNIVGFAIADLQDHNIWALFIHPDFEKQGIGKQLHNTMLNWYFSQTQTTVWLGTAPNTRAAEFYRLMGWKEVGINGTKELKFEMTHQQWQQQQVIR